MSYKTKWIDFLYRVATGSRKVRNFLTPIGALIYGLLIFMFVVLALLADHAIGIRGLLPDPLNVILSVPVFGVALFLIGWSVRHFFEVKGTPVPVNPPPKLVTTGPYAYTRNPMLTGVFALMFGFGLFYGSVSLLFVLTPLFILINFWELKVIEEPEIEQRLGEPYRDYRKKTPMFFPRIGGTGGTGGREQS